MACLPLLHEAQEFVYRHRQRFPILESLGALAQRQARPESAVLLGGNGRGKSTCIELLLLNSLGDDAEYTSGREADGQLGAAAAAALVAARLADGQSVPDAVSSSAFVLLANPDSSLNRDHIAEMHSSLQGYFSGDQFLFKERTSLLLPVGAETDTTTKNALYITHDDTVAACIQPKSVEQLEQLAYFFFKAMADAASGDLDDAELVRDKEFTTHAELMKLLTGVDVLHLFRTSVPHLKLLELLEGLRSREEQAPPPAQRPPPPPQDSLASQQQPPAEQAPLQQDQLPQNGAAAQGAAPPEEAQPPRLDSQLRSFVERLRPVIYLGTRESLSSDMRFVRDAIQNPLESLMAACPRAAAKTPDNIAKLLGLLIDHVKVTVPCRLLENVQLVDIPGTNDANPLADLIIKQALDHADHVVAFLDKNLGADSDLVDRIRFSEWHSKQINDQTGKRGELILLHHPETLPVYQGLQSRTMWKAEFAKNAGINRSTSVDHMLATVMASLPSNCTPEECAARCAQYKEHVHAVTLLPATFSSLALAKMTEVHASLKGAAPSTSPLATHCRLIEMTGMQQTLERLVLLSSNQDISQIEAMRSEAQRCLAALALGGTGCAHAPEQLLQWSKRLADKIQDNAGISLLVQTVKTYQPARGEQHAAMTVEQIKQHLSSGLVLEFGHMLRECTARKLTDGGIVAMVEQAIHRLGESKATRAHLNAICRNQCLQTSGAPNIVSDMRAQLLVRASAALQLRKEAIRRLHSDAARRVCDNLLNNMGVTERDDELKAFMSSEELWVLQMEATLVEEFVRMAETAVLQGGAFDSYVEELVNSCLKAQLIALPQENRNVRSSRFIRRMQAPLVAGLTAVRQQLPTVIADAVRRYVEEELFADDKLFLSITRAGHHMVQLEDGKIPAPQLPAAAAAGVAGQAAPAPARRMRKRQQLLLQYQSQVCLWRNVRRYYQAVQTNVADQGADQIEAVRVSLTQLVANCGRVLDLYRGDTSRLLSERLGRSLAHEALQRVRLSQVLPDSRPGAVAVTAVPLALDVEVDGTSVKGTDFAAAIGDFTLPAELVVDTLSSLQALQQSLRTHHGLAWNNQYTPPSHSNVLAAAYSGWRGNLPDGQDGIRRLREIVAFEMVEDEELLPQKLEQAGVGRMPAMAYIEDYLNERQWGGLLALNYLAASHKVSFLVWTAKQCPGDAQRFQAFLISPEQATGAQLHVYPLMMVAVMHDDRVLPLYMPLFVPASTAAHALAEAVPVSLAASSHLSLEGVNWGDEGEAAAVLSTMAGPVGGDGPRPSKRPRH